MSHTALVAVVETRSQVRAFAILLAVSVVLMLTASARAAGALPRSLVDRPDDLTGAQIHLIYAIPRDGADHHHDTTGAIRSSFASAQQWLAGQTGGRRMRIDTDHGSPDITFVRLPESDSKIASHGVYSRDEIEALVRSLGFRSPMKTFEVFYDGSSTVCGSAPLPPSLPGHVPVIFLQGAPPGAPACDSHPFAGPGQPAGYFEMDELHEILHTLGMVPDCAPHSIGNGHVNDSPTDLMYQGPLPWDTANMVLDIGHDDYFDSHISGCIDFSRSAFLQGGTQLPPAWSQPPPHPPLCIVPRLRSLTVPQARQALTSAYCRLGPVHQDRRGTRDTVLRVVSQSTPPDTVTTAGWRVRVTVKPFPRRGRARTLLQRHPTTIKAF